MGRYHENIFTHFFEGSYLPVLPQEIHSNLLSMRLLHLNKLDKIVSRDKLLPFHRGSSFLSLSLSFLFFYYFFLKNKFTESKTISGNWTLEREHVALQVQNHPDQPVPKHEQLSLARTPKPQVTTSSLMVKWHNEEIKKRLTIKTGM